jgi:hypothetical protein
MIKLDPDWSQGHRRLEDFAPGELEAFMQRGRSLQARAMGQGLLAALRALFGTEPSQPARTERGELDWERVLGSRADAPPTAPAADPARTADRLGRRGVPAPPPPLLAIWRARALGSLHK